MAKCEKLEVLSAELARSLGSYVGNYKGSPYRDSAEKALEEYKTYLAHWNRLGDETITEWDRLESKIMTILSDEDSELSEIRGKAEDIVEIVKGFKVNNCIDVLPSVNGGDS